MSVYSAAKKKSFENGNIVLSFALGLIVSMLVSFGLVLLLAFLLKWFAFEDKFIVPGTMAIKCISVLIGAMIAVKGNSKGLFKGVVFGIIYITLALVVFSILAGSFSIDISTLLDVLCAALLSGIVGIIKVNKK